MSALITQLFANRNWMFGFGNFCTNNDVLQSPEDQVYSFDLIPEMLWPRSSFQGEARTLLPDPMSQLWEYNVDITGQRRRKKISGITKDSVGNILGGATVKLYNTVTGLLVDSGISNSLGEYELADPNDVPSFVVAYKAGVADVVGTTKNNLAEDWSPLKMPSAMFWNPLDANSLLPANVNGSNLVAQINDIGVRNLHFLQSTDVRKPFYNVTGINGFPALEFDAAAGERMDFAANALSVVGFIAFVFQPAADINASSAIMCPVSPSAASTTGVLSFGSATGVFLNEIVTLRHGATSLVAYIHASAVIDAASPHWIAVFYNLATGMWEIYVDDPTVNLAYPIPSGTPGVMPLNTARIGQQVDGINAYDGMFGALLMAPAGSRSDVIGWDAWVNTNYGF